MPPFNQNPSNSGSSNQNEGENKEINRRGFLKGVLGVGMSAIGASVLGAQTERAPQSDYDKKRIEELRSDNHGIKRDIRQKEEILRILVSLTPADIEEFNHYKKYKSEVLPSSAAGAAVGMGFGKAVTTLTGANQESKDAAIVAGGVVGGLGGLVGLKVNEIRQPAFFKQIPNLDPLGGNKVFAYFDSSLENLSDESIVNEKEKVKEEIDILNKKIANNQESLRLLGE